MYLNFLYEFDTDLYSILLIVLLQIKEKIEEEEVMQKSMEEDIHTLQQEILEQKKKQRGANGTHERHAQFQKQIRILENRLDKANQKFNEAISKNKRLRETIDSLRRERVIFDNIYRKLEKELHERRGKMANIIGMLALNLLIILNF